MSEVVAAEMLRAVLTKKGLAAANQAATLGKPVKITHVGVTGTPGTPNDGMTTLPGEVGGRLKIADGKVISDTQVNVSALLPDTFPSVTIHGVGYYLEDGTLFSVYQSQTPLLIHTQGATLLIGMDFVLENIPNGSVIVESTGANLIMGDWVPTYRKLNGYVMDKDINLTAGDVKAVRETGGTYTGNFRKRMTGSDAWPDADSKSDKNYVRRAALSALANNNGIHFFGDERMNARRLGIQAGHSDAAYAEAVGVLDLNPFGGDVRANGHRVYTPGNKPKPADLGALATDGSNELLGNLRISGVAQAVDRGISVRSGTNKNAWIKLVEGAEGEDYGMFFHYDGADPSNTARIGTIENNSWKTGITFARANAQATFAQVPLCATAPTAGNHLVNKTYADSKVPDTRTINGKRLNGDIRLTLEDLGFEETDLSGYVPKTRKVNGKALDADINLTAYNVGAVPQTQLDVGSSTNGRINCRILTIHKSDCHAAFTIAGQGDFGNRERGWYDVMVATRSNGILIRAFQLGTGNPDPLELHSKLVGDEFEIWATLSDYNHSTPVNLMSAKGANIRCDQVTTNKDFTGFTKHEIEVYYTSQRKPTPSEVGALSLADGGTVRGQIIIDRENSALSIQRSAYPGMSLVSKGSTNHRLKLIEVNNGGALTFITRDENGANKGVVSLQPGKDGEIYHTGNKPTAADVGAVQRKVYGETANLDDFRDAQHFRLTHDYQGGPLPGTQLPYAQGIHVNGGGDTHMQIVGGYNKSRIFWRGFNNSMSQKTDWAEFYTSLNKPTPADVLGGDGSYSQRHVINKPAGAVDGKYYPVMFSNLNDYSELFIDTVTSSGNHPMNNCSFKGFVRSGGWSDRGSYVVGQFNIYGDNERALYGFLGGSESDNCAVAYIEARAFPIRVTANSKVSVAASASAISYGSSTFPAAVTEEELESIPSANKVRTLVEFDKGTGWYGNQLRFNWMTIRDGGNFGDRVNVENIEKSASFITKRRGKTNFAMFGHSSAGHAILGLGDGATYSSYLQVGSGYKGLTYNPDASAQHAVYHEGYKPSAADVKALALDGSGKMTGALKSAAGAQFEGSVYSNFNSSTTGSINIGGNGAGYAEVVGKAKGQADYQWSNGIRYYDDNTWRIGANKIYHEAFKPTAADVNAVSKTGGDYYGNFRFRKDGMNGWPTTTANDANNYVRQASASAIAGNSGLHFFGDQKENARRMGIQSAHADAGYTTNYGVLDLNPFGGDVRVNGYKVYTPGNKPTASDIGALPSNGTATAANKLATARQINGTNFDGQGNITTNYWGYKRNFTIGNATMGVDGSGNVSWTLAQIGAATPGEVSTAANNVKDWVYGNFLATARWGGTAHFYTGETDSPPEHGNGWIVTTASYAEYNNRGGNICRQLQVSRAGQWYTVGY